MGTRLALRGCTKDVRVQALGPRQELPRGVTYVKPAAQVEADRALQETALNEYQGLPGCVTAFAENQKQRKS